MSFAPEFHVPGAYRFDSTTRHGSALSAGIFRPPASPSASSYNLAKSTGSLYSDISMSTTPAYGTTKRKRVSTRESTPVEWNMNMDGANDSRGDEKAAISAQQSRYTLAGNINATPFGVPNGAENGILEESVYSDVDYRRALGPKEMYEETESPSVQLNLDGSRFDRANTSSSAAWSTLALHTIGDVVGKVWEFCKTGAFRGFHAGGGKGYDLDNTATTSTPERSQPWCNEHDIPSFPSGDPPFNQAPPGHFPQTDFMPFSPEYHEMSTPETTPRRPAAKRRQVSENSELNKNWVLVDEPRNQRPRGFGAALQKAASRPSTARTRQPGYYSQTAASTGRRINVPISRLGGGTPSSLPRGRTSLRISHAGSPLTFAPREPASFAQPRSPVSRTTPSRIPVPSQSANPFGLSGTSVASLSRPASRQSRVSSPAPSSSPTKGHRRNQSGASTVSTARRARTGDHIDVDDIQASPRLDAEAKQLAQKKLAVERDTDMRVDAFNARLMMMIRQGKEALGTRVEVLDDGQEEVGGGVGWVDDD